jgi:hypothetical protein
VANAILYDTVANVAAIPASPANNDAVEVVNSTGIESFSPLSGKPAGFVGDSGLSVRIVYTTAGSTWNWIQYFPNDPENRYGDAITTLQGDVTTLQTDLSQAETDILGLDTVKLDATTAASTYLTQSNAASTYLTQSNAASTYQTQSGMSSYLTTSTASNTYMPKSGGTFTGAVVLDTSSAHSIKGGQVVLSDTLGNYKGTLQTALGSLLLTGGVEFGVNNTGTGGSGKFRVSGATGNTEIDGSLSVGGSPVLVSSAIGTTVQSYDADTAKTDVAQTFTAAQRGAYVTLTDAATIATDLSLGNQFQVTLGGNRTLGAPTNVVAGQSGVIRVVQDGTGSRTLAYNSVFKFPGGTAPTLTTTANAVDLLAYHVESTTRIAVRFIGDVK